MAQTRVCWGEVISSPYSASAFDLTCNISPFLFLYFVSIRISHVQIRLSFSFEFSLINPSCTCMSIYAMFRVINKMTMLKKKSCWIGKRKTSLLSKLLYWNRRKNVCNSAHLHSLCYNLLCSGLMIKCCGLLSERIDVWWLYILILLLDYIIQS